MAKNTRPKDRMRARCQFKFRTKYGIDILPYTTKQSALVLTLPFLSDSVVSKGTLAAQKAVSNSEYFFSLENHFFCVRSISAHIFDWTNNLLTSERITVIDVEAIMFIQFRMKFDRCSFSRFHSGVHFLFRCVKFNVNFSELIQFLAAHIRTRTDFNDGTVDWYWGQNMVTWSSRNVELCCWLDSKTKPN